MEKKTLKKDKISRMSFTKGPRRADRLTGLGLASGLALSYLPTNDSEDSVLLRRPLGDAVSGRTDVASALICGKRLHMEDAAVRLIGHQRLSIPLPGEESGGQRVGHARQTDALSYLDVSIAHTVLG